jgi:phosphoribosylformylglycinamidine (FGAM) synthase-like amidotransferase family enzyme
MDTPHALLPDVMYSVNTKCREAAAQKIMGFCNGMQTRKEFKLVLHEQGRMCV